MKRFVLLSFLVLGWVFFEMSGGTAFEPETREQAFARAVAEGVIDAPEQSDPIETRITAAPAEESVAPEVTRARTEILASFAQPEEQPASIEEVAETPVEAAVAAAVVTPQTIITSEQAAPVEAPLDLRQVAGSWVNMRDGPGTAYNVVTTVPEGTEAEVLEIANGWARIRLLETDQIGWMAERLLDES